MEREKRIKKYNVGYFWEYVIKTEFSIMNIEFQEIVLIEEIIPYSNYTGFARIKSHSKKDEFIEIMVSFDKRGIPSISINSTIINSVLDYLDGGTILLDKISSKSLVDGLPGGSHK